MPPRKAPTPPTKEQIQQSRQRRLDSLRTRHFTSRQFQSLWSTRVLRHMKEQARVARSDGGARPIIHAGAFAMLQRTCDGIEAAALARRGPDTHTYLLQDVQAAYRVLGVPLPLELSGGHGVKAVESVQKKKKKSKEVEEN